MENKKYLIVLILRVLETETDEMHPITQVKLAEIISKVYNCDRKTVGRNIKFLTKIGYPIVKTPKGFYMDNKQFSRAEIDFIVNLVKNSENASIETQELGKRLYDALSRYYKK